MASFHYLSRISFSLGSYFSWLNWGVNILIKGFLGDWLPGGKWEQQSVTDGIKRESEMSDTLTCSPRSSAQSLENKSTAKRQEKLAWRNVLDLTSHGFYCSSWFPPMDVGSCPGSPRNSYNCISISFVHTEGPRIALSQSMSFCHNVDEMPENLTLLYTN